MCIIACAARRNRCPVVLHGVPSAISFSGPRNVRGGCSFKALDRAAFENTEIK